MTTDEYVDAILVREGPYQDDPRDRGNANGGATNWGITSTSWGAYKGNGRPATREEVRAITRSQAADFYRTQYVQNSPFKVVGHEGLKSQLIDYAILSGTARATRWLQRVLGVPVTSLIDARTVTALNVLPGSVVNNALVAARLEMFRRIVKDDDSQKAFLHGWTNRALSFVEFPA